MGKSLKSPKTVSRCFISIVCF